MKTASAYFNNSCLQLWELVSDAGIVTNQDEFDRIYQASCDEFGSSQISVQGFRQVRWSFMQY